MRDYCETCGTPLAQRSAQTHRHFFASIAEAYNNLPEDIAGDFASPEHLRKWALIKAGFRNEVSTVCATRAEAIRWGAALRRIDDYAVVIVRGVVVTHYTAKSQSFRAMGKAEFQRSKDAVFDVLAKLIGTDVADLKAARAA